MLDNTTPHVAVPVQAIRGGEVIAIKLSDERGRYQFANLKPGQYNLRCQVLSGYVYYGEEKTIESEIQIAGTAPDRPISLQIEQGETLENIDFRFAPFKKGTWKNYDTLSGLSSNSVQRILRDPKGMIWVATMSGGVSCYDGKGFTHFGYKDGLPSANVRDIHIDINGVIWFAAAGGIARYDGEEFTRVLIDYYSLAHINVCTIYSDADSTLWIGTTEGVLRYDGMDFINLTMENGLVDNRVYAIFRATDGMMWFGTAKGVSRYDDRGFLNLTTEDGLVNNSTKAICETSSGMIWFGTAGGVSCYYKGEFYNLTTRDGLIHDNVLSIYSDFKGVMWFGTRYGVSRYDGKTFVNFTTRDGLVNNLVQDIYRSPDGAMWFATGNLYEGERGGVSRYDNSGLINFIIEDGLPQNSISAICYDSDGVMWIGTKDGYIAFYDGQRFISFSKEGELSDKRITEIHCGLDKVMWFGTDGSGVFRYDGQNLTNFTAKDGLASNSVWAVYEDPNGVLWLGTTGGVSRYDENGFVNFTASDGLVSNYIAAIQSDSDSAIWFGTMGYGVSRYDGEDFKNISVKDGLAGNVVTSIYRDANGLIWFGTDGGGVSCYNGNEFTNFSSESGLADNTVWTIYGDATGMVWFGTESGVSCYDGVSWTSLDTRDGLAGNSVVSICQDPDGYLWFATENGIARYHPSAVLPKAQIISVTSDQTYKDLDNLPSFILGDRITIRYSSIDFVTAPEKRQYRIRIKELDRNWRKPTKDNAFDYIFDKSGTYTFEVQAINRDLNYSEPVSLSLTIEPDPVLMSMQTELSYLRREVGQKYHFENIIGHSVGIKQVRALMERAIDSGLTVLITGETGTGKELVAKAIHHNSPRRDRPLLDLNCGAVSKELISSTLFGHRKGAFTGAQDDQIGFFEAASGGTILLDEISEMPQDSQVHLLRVLEEHKVQRLGEHISRDVDVRVIAITNRDLMKEVLEGRFREDLYYRLSVFPIRVPPLRERPEDVPILAEHFLQEIVKQLDGFAPDVFEMLQSYSWPGNVRELRNAIHRAAALAEDKIQTYDFPPEITRGESLIQDIASERLGLSASVETLQRRLIEDALRECNGNNTYAARMLKMHRSNFVRLMKRLGIEYPDVPN